MTAILPDFEKEVEFDTNLLLHGEELFNALDEIERAPLPSGVIPLLDFVDKRGSAESYGVEPHPDAVPPYQWYSAGDGLATVRALREHFAADPDVVQYGPELLADIEALETMLLSAQKSGSRFHLIWAQ